MILKRLFTTYKRLLSVKKSQFDTKYIIENSDKYLKSIQDRELLIADELVRDLKELPVKYGILKDLNHQISQVQTNRKSIEKEIKLDKTNIEKLRCKLIELKQDFHHLVNSQTKITNEIFQTCLSLPNLTHDSVPKNEPEVVRWINPKEQYIQEPTRDHRDIMIRKNLIDFDTASDVTGSSWYYLVNEGAMLEQALVNYATKKAREAGFSLCLPPSIVKNEIIDACGFRPRDANNEQQIYHLNNSQLGLTATAEIPLAAMGLNKVYTITPGHPIKLCGVSRSYRSEAGARGRDTRGLYRVHEFTKVELFCWSHPSDSDKVLHSLKNFQLDIIKDIGLSARVLNMPANDLGSPAYQKYDIEAWMPGRGSFGEVTSTSNCTDYQSRRMNTKFRNSLTQKLEYVHTLNATAMAVPRVILAIVENFYDPLIDKIHVPKVLRLYMDNMEYI